MLIESQPQQPSTPPTPQLGGMVSSPSPQNSYNMIERLKLRVGKYRLHHQMSCQKNDNTIEAQNRKMKDETNRLQQQFLNNTQNNSNTNNKSKQQKSVNTTGAQRNANKRSNSLANNSNNCNNNNDSKSESTDTKPTKMPKLSNSRSAANSSAKGLQLSPNNSKFNPNSQSNQMDIKMKPSIASSCNSQPLLPNNSINASISPLAAPEIKREVMDSSYFETVTVEAIRDYLPNAGEPFSSDIMKDLFSDTSFADDGLAGANFGDEDFIANFLEEINASPLSFADIEPNFGQPMNSMQFKPQTQQAVNHMISSNNENNSNNGMNSNLNTNQMNGNNGLTINLNQMNASVPYTTTQFQTTTNEMMTSYHPIQPRLQPNLMTNIPNRSSVQRMSVNNTNFTPIAINSNNTRNYMNSGSGAQPQQQLLLQQMINVLPQQNLNSVQLQQQSQTSHLILQQQPSQPVHQRLASGAAPRMGIVSVVPKSENNVSVQLSIQVPQQQQQQQQTPQSTPNQTSSQAPQSTQSQASANASIKLKQMAQQVQQKTHHWVINHSNVPLTQNALQPMTHQLPQQSQPSMAPTAQRLTQQTPQQRQVLSPEVQNQIQLQHQNQTQKQNYFTPQMAQQMYWTQPQSQPQPQSQAQTQTQNQPQLQTQQLTQQNMQQNQQNFANYWSHPSQMVGQPSQQQPQQQQPQQSQHFYNNSYNYF